MKDSTYHSLLRISALTFAMILLFDSGLLTPITRHISQDTQQYLGQAIGMYASVQPTDLNEMTAELTQRDRLLTQRENELAAREIAVDLEKKSAPSSGYSTYILSLLLFVILMLIVLNYSLDFVRARERIVTQTNEKVA